jgi:hypothetical protein
MPSKHFSEIVSACCALQNPGGTPRSPRPASVIASWATPLARGFHGHEVATEATGEGPRSLQCGKAEPIAFDGVAPQPTGELLGERVDG